MEKCWGGPQKNKVKAPGAVSSTPFLTFLSVSLSSLSSSTSSSKVRLDLSFLTTELPRGFGRCALSITPSSGKNRSGLMVGRFLFNAYQGKQNISRCTTSSGAATLNCFYQTCSSLHTAHITYLGFTSDAVMNTFSGVCRRYEKTVTTAAPNHRGNLDHILYRASFGSRYKSCCTWKMHPRKKPFLIPAFTLLTLACCVLLHGTECDQECSLITVFVFTGWCLQNLLLRASWWWVQSFDTVEGRRLKPDRPALL